MHAPIPILVPVLKFFFNNPTFLFSVGLQILFLFEENFIISRHRFSLLYECQPKHSVTLSTVVGEDGRL